MDSHHISLLYAHICFPGSGFLQLILECLRILPAVYQDLHTFRLIAAALSV